MCLPLSSLFSLFIISFSFFLQKYLPKETTTSSPKSAISSESGRISSWGVVDGSGFVYETGNSTLMGKMSKGEIGKIYIREEEEVGIWILTCEERIVEVEGTSTWENEICEDVGVVWDVWVINETDGARGEVGLTTYANTNRFVEVSLRMGFKFR